MRDRAVTFVLAILALLFFVGLYTEPKRQQQTTSANTADQGEQGLAAFFQWLKTRDTPVLSYRKRWFELIQSHPMGHALISHAAYEQQVEADASWQGAPKAYVELRETEGIVAWVAAGNSLIVPVNYIDVDRRNYQERFSSRNEIGDSLNLLRAFGWEAHARLEAKLQPRDESFADLQDNNTSSPEKLSKDRDQPTLTAEEKADLISLGAERAQVNHQLLMRLPGDKDQGLAIERLSYERQGLIPPFELRKRFDRREQCLDEEIATEPRDYSEDRITDDGETIAVDEEECFAKGLHQWQPLLYADLPADAAAAISSTTTTPVGWWLPFGRGKLIVLAYGGLFRNNALANADNARAGEQLLRWAAPNGQILFDDYRYGLSEIYDPEAFFRDSRFWMCMGILALLWLIYAVGRSTRMLPVRLPRQRPSTARFANMLSAFFARQLSDREAAELLIEQFLLQNRARFGFSREHIQHHRAMVWDRLTQLLQLPSDIERIQSLADGRDNVALSALLGKIELQIEQTPHLAIVIS